MGVRHWWGYLWARISGKYRREARLLSAATGDGEQGGPKLLPAAKSEEVEAPSASASHEAWLEELISHCADGMRISEVGESEFWREIDGLWGQGDELLAGQWIEKFLMLDPLDSSILLQLRLRLVQMFDERGDLYPVMSHLDELTQSPEHATDAHFKLAEHYRRRGDELLALREYEAVLAKDVDYPNVRQRYERLRALRGELGAVSASETMVGAGSGTSGDGSRYLLVRELGRGAAGVAYLARDMQLEREVAVKLLHPHLAGADQKEALQMFFDEARVAASLRHPNIVAILDLDVKARRIVMELCDGGTLRALLRDRGPRPLRRALERHAQILSALDAAHARGVVHRDLKPANLMFRRDPAKPGAEIVLGDFGIAHLPNADGLRGEERAATDRAVGTMAYMAPEQRRGEVTQQSDLYAAAVVLFEMLTGRYPWSREQLLAGTRRPGDFALPASLRSPQPKLGAMLQAHLDGLGDPIAANRPETTTAMKEARRLRDLSMIACRAGDPSL